MRPLSWYEICCLAKDGVSDWAMCQVEGEKELRGVAMSKAEEVSKNSRIQNLENQIEELTLQLHDYEMVKEQLTQAQKRETLASLSGGIAHDFNNILHCILGYTEMALSEKRNGSTDFETLEQIQAIVKRGRDLAQRFLMFGKKNSHHSVELNLNTIIEEVGCLLLRTIPRNITLEHELDSTLSSITGNEGQCEQIVMNLCINAMDAMPHGGKLTIKTENFHFTPNCPLHARLGITPGSYVHISVSDTGIGMSKDTLHKIFEPFFTTKEKNRGSGLGLSVVASLIRSHGGYFDCTSSPGLGSTFDIYLPSENVDYAYNVPKEEKCYPHDSRGSEVILFVDDEKEIINIGKRFLEQRGYKVLTAGDCEEGLDIYKNNTVDMVIMDVGLPDMGGAEFLKNLQSINGGVKVLAISGYHASSMSVRELGLEEQDFLQKPFSFEELMTKVRTMLDDKTLPIIQMPYQGNLRE